MFASKNKHIFKKAATLNPRSRRDPNRLVLEVTPTLALYSKSCLKMCVKVFNKLPDHLKELNAKALKPRL